MRPETFSDKRVVETDHGPRTNQDHCTPVYLIEAIKAAWGGIDLDPCSNPWSQVGALLEYSKHRGEDGLKSAWPLEGLIYLNPPFGELVPWVERCNDHFEDAPDVHQIMVCPFSPERGWWKTAWNANKAAACWPRRIAWEGSGSSPPFATTLFYWGPDKHRFWRWALAQGCEIFTLPRVRAPKKGPYVDPRQLRIPGA